MGPIIAGWGGCGEVARRAVRRGLPLGTAGGLLGTPLSSVPDEARRAHPLSDALARARSPPPLAVFRALTGESSPHGALALAPLSPRSSVRRAAPIPHRPAPAAARPVALRPSPRGGCQARGATSHRSGRGAPPLP